MCCISSCSYFLIRGEKRMSCVEINSAKKIILGLALPPCSGVQTLVKLL